MNPGRRPLYVVGRGALSCFGRGHAVLSDAVFAGERGVRPLRRLRDCDCPTTVAAEVPEQLVAAAGSTAELPLYLAREAAREALAEAGPSPDRTAVLLATTKAELAGIRTPAEAPRPAGLGNPRHLLDRLLAELHGDPNRAFDGPQAAVSCACASGLAALAQAGRWLRSGRAERALVVGVDVLDPFVMAGFGALLALDSSPCRPFDRDRRGLSLGEGAGAMVLATRPEPNSYGRLAGWGERNDANHITGPSRDGAGLAAAVDAALEHAGVETEALDFVHLHGTGTPYNDAMEGQALRRVFGDRLAKHSGPPAAGSKAQLGHTLGAAGLLESLITLEALRRGSAPASVGLKTADRSMPLPLSARPQNLQRSSTALKLAAGFGGIDVALVFRHVG